MKCTECGNATTKSVGDHLYLESGLDNVILRNTTKYTCESCGAVKVAIVAMGQLHRAIASLLATKPARLTTKEVRFLRDHLDLNNKEFAELMGVTPEQASRWTTTDAIGVPAERFLRMLAALGPEAVAARSTKEIAAELLETMSEQLGALIHAMGQLPPSTAQVAVVPINLRRATSGWKSDATTKQAN